MSTADAKAFIEEPQVCVLATHGPGDDTHAMPMWYRVDGDAIVMMSQPGTQKVKNIERTGRATLVFDRREAPYYAVMVKGEAEVGPALDADGRRAIVSRYLDGAELERYLAGLEARAPITLRVRPTRYIEFRGSARG